MASRLPKWPPDGSSTSASSVPRPRGYGPSNHGTPKPKVEKPMGAGTNEGSLASFLGKQLGVQHTGRSTGMVKTRMDTSTEAQDRAYHANKTANAGMAQAFSAMVMGAKGTGGTEPSMPKPSELKKQTKGKPTTPSPARTVSAAPVKPSSAPAASAVSILAGTSSTASRPQHKAVATKQWKPPQPKGPAPQTQASKTASKPQPSAVPAPKPTTAPAAAVSKPKPQPAATEINRRASGADAALALLSGVQTQMASMSVKPETVAEADTEADAGSATGEPATKSRGGNGTREGEVEGVAT